MKISKKMKNIVILSILLNSSFLFHTNYVNASNINLENLAFIYSVGGSKKDIYNDGVENSKGELISIGYTASGSDLGSSSLGSDDGLLTKHNADGSLAWIKRMGGSGRDRFTSIVLNDDDSVVVAGKTKSTDNNFSTNGDYDAVIAKVSDEGDILWTKNWGGTTIDSFNDIIKTSDGGYLAVGETDSIDSEDPTSGLLDFLAVKFSESGDIEWAKTYGGSGDDSALSTIEVSDGYIIAGNTGSNDNGFSNNSYIDATVFKIDKSGSIGWIKTFGGGPFDSFRSITGTDNGFICVGETYSKTDEIQNNGASGTRDGVIVKYDLSGNIEFIKTFGGTDNDVFTQIIPTHLNTYMAIGYSSSTDANFINRGSKDIVIVEYDVNGNPLKINSFGGNGDEEIDKGVYTIDGSLVFFGESKSTDLTSENKGEADAVIFKYNISIEEAVKAVAIAENSRHSLDISNARNKVNVLPSSIYKTMLNNRLEAIIPLEDEFPTLELKKSTANVDVYIKSLNSLNLSLSTNSITFEDFSGVDNLKQENAVTLTVDSSLPYEINAYLATDIQNATKDKTMNKEILKIKANEKGEEEYKSFIDINTTPIKLLDNQEAGNNIEHGIDIMLKGGLAFDKDVYKTTIKFEAEQK